jgi:hypothetical protein
MKLIIKETSDDLMKFKFNAIYPRFMICFVYEKVGDRLILGNGFHIEFDGPEIILYKDENRFFVLQLSDEIMNFITCDGFDKLLDKKSDLSYFHSQISGSIKMNPTSYRIKIEGHVSTDYMDFDGIYKRSSHFNGGSCWISPLYSSFHFYYSFERQDLPQMPYIECVFGTNNTGTSVKSAIPRKN